MATAALLAVALASTAWTLLPSILCFGSLCGENWRITGFTCVALLAMLSGTVLVLPSRTRAVGRVVLVVPVVIAVVATLADAFAYES